MNKTQKFLSSIIFCIVVMAALQIVVSPTSAAPVSTTTTYLVTNTQDSGPGSFRQAILDLNANPGPNKIAFDIPPTDPNFVGYQDDGLPGSYDPFLPLVPVTGTVDPDGPQWWQIAVTSSLPNITQDDSFVDGGSQRFNQHDSNPFGPEIEIANYGAGIVEGLGLVCNNSVVQDLIINGFGTAFDLGILGNENRLKGSYIGVEPGGASAAGYVTSGGDYHVSIGGNANIVGGLSVVDRNLISGGSLQSIGIAGTGNHIVGNYIGVNRSATVAIRNSVEVIKFWGGSEHIVEYNVIGGSSETAITLNKPGGASETIIRHNFIGIDPTLQFNIAGSGNGPGIVIGSLPGNMIGPGNVIQNHFDGVGIYSPTAQGNTITQNAISNNDRYGIYIFSNGNNGIQPPVILFAGSSYVTGTAAPQATIEIFSDNEDEGAIYEGVTQADAQGQFTWYGSLTGPFVTATATNEHGNTSAFSLPQPAFAVWVPLLINEG
jgi:parallel beta-helix repeat protein